MTDFTNGNVADHSFDLEAFVKRLPKVELHIHLEGSPSPETLFKLAGKYDVPLPDRTVEELFHFPDLESFFEIYEVAVHSMRHEDDFHLVTYEMLRRCSESNVRYAEFFFNPQPHLAFGIDYPCMMRGIGQAQIDAEADFGIRSAVIPSYDRRLGPDAGDAFIDMLLSARTERVVGIGMDYLEHPHRPSAYRAMYDRARNAGFQLTAHVGFRGGADQVWEAVDILRCGRIDHGYHVVEDMRIAEQCHERNVAFTCCPTSALSASKWRDPDAPTHPIRRMIELGLFVTLNTDDPGLFRTSLNDEFMLVAKHMNVDSAGLLRLAYNSLQASWLDKSDKEQLLLEWRAEIDACGLPG